MMVTLGCYDLLPNQSWRDLYLRTGIITCTTQDANEYAATTDESVQELRNCSRPLWLILAA